MTRLRREWYAKLRADGFRDIEGITRDGRDQHAVSNVGSVRTDSGSRLATKTWEYEAHLEYFARAGEFLAWFEFKNETDRRVWELHADGASLRDIAASCGISLKAAHVAVARLRDTMNAWRHRRESVDVEGVSFARRSLGVVRLHEHQWRAIEPLLRQARTGRPPRDHRQVVEGLVWLLRSGAPWRELPAVYGPWRTAYSRFLRWRRAGVWGEVVKSIDFADTLSSRESVRFSSEKQSCSQHDG